MVDRLRPFLIVAGLALAACSRNPATGERQLVLVSEGREIALGRTNDTGIVGQMGLYPDSSLQLYLRQLGGKLAAASERPGLPWTFRVVDEPIVNAFAVPGGFIYITRGILAHLNSEAQLAAVLGHEIGHVTARHSVEQMSRAQLANVGMGLGMIFSPEFRQVGDLAGAGLGVLFLKFGRDDETQADELGLRYLVKAGYDPRPMPDVYGMLGRVGGGEGGRVPTWLSTHPDPENRRGRMLQQIAAMNQSFDGRPVGRDPYLARLDGLLFGPNPREGYFDGTRFLHPDLAFEITFPSGWKTANQKQAVRALSPEQDAMMEVTLAQGTPDAAARAFFEGKYVPAPARRTAIHGLPAVVGEFGVTTQQGQQLGGIAAFIDLGGRTFQVLGYGVLQTWNTRGALVDRAAGSFARLTDRAALDVMPQRISIVRLTGAMTLSEFAARWPSDVDREKVALINQAELATLFPAGSLVKRVVRAR
jgi:predicted Zn-dependent protease